MTTTTTTKAESAEESAPTIEFDAESHTYTVDGSIIPSVTHILEVVGAVDGTWFTERARLRGTHVHSYLALYDHGLISLDDIPEGSRGYAESWRKFLTASGAVVREIELRLFSSAFRYCGTLDRIIELKGRPSLPDFKTGAPQRWHALQTAAYANALGLSSIDRFGLHLHQDGAVATVHPHKDVNDWPDFKSALGWYYARKRRGL